MAMMNPSATAIDHNGPRASAQPSEDPVETDTAMLSSSGPAEVRLEDGIPGLSDGQSWTLGPLDPDVEDGAFYVLAADGDPDVSVIVADPWTFFGDYGPDLPDNELEALGIESISDAVVLCAVTLDAGETCFYLNLLGPFVFHGSTGAGRQMVLGDQDWPIRARVDVPS